MPFYDQISSFYDEMISFKSRFENEKKVFESVLKKYPAKTILDAGCGSGYHSSILASLGSDVTGFDPAEKMLTLAEKNIQKYGVKAEFLQADYLSFPSHINHKFDAIYTLGNSFVHLTTLEEISEALYKFRSTLNIGGYVCLGILNFDKVLENNEMEVSKKEKNGKIFHRYYSLNDSTITFNIDITENDHLRHFETKLYPLQSNQLIKLAYEAGFKKTEIYGSMKLDRYSQLESENILAFLFL